jgi:CTP synthase (UTP-ammonia lyase)
VRIALVGDRNDSIPAHQAIPLALALAARTVEQDVEPTWLPSDAVGAGDGLAAYDAIWCVPGSPYRSMDGALSAIRYAREKLIPFLGTCGGFQHAMIEYARNVCGLAGAEHAESAPGSALAIVTLLACPLLGAQGRVRLAPGSRIQAAYAAEHSLEEYQCRFGLEARWRQPLEAAGLVFTAFDDEGDVRAAELPSHPFFVATLFQPERAALRGTLPPLVLAFVRATSSRRPPA